MNNKLLNENSETKQDWNEQNKKFIEEYNKLLKREELPLQEYRQF